MTGKGRGHHTPHTEESRQKMSESHKRGFAEGRRTGQNKHNAEKTHCPQGHPYDEENTYHIPGGGRGCKECTRQRTRDRRAEQRKARPPKQAKAPKRQPDPGEPAADHRMGSPGRRKYDRLHGRNRRTRGSARLQKCVHCAERGIDKQAQDWARLRDRDGEDVQDYIPLCRRCHIFYDQPPAAASEAAENPGARGGPGDPAIGQRRAAQQRAKTHCPHGHEYTPENTYTIERSGGRTGRQCKTCMREQREARRRGRRDLNPRTR